jgi:hypothetical protein
MNSHITAKPGVTCGSFSISVTEMPKRAKFSQTSSPIKPVPTIATFDIF